MTSPDANAEVATRVDTVILMAHGSRNDAANTAHLDLCAAVAARVSPLTVRPAFLELTEPSLADTVATAAGEGSRVISVLPYFLHPGNHTTRDIPALVDEARVAHPELTIEIASAFGSDPSVIGIIERQILSAVSPSGTR